MRILSIDSSLGSQLLIADAAPSPSGLSVTVVASASESDSRRHAENLGPMLARALEQAGPAPLELVVGATGPAPFTGLRAGLVTGRTVARARGIEIVGMPSLDAVARKAFDEIAAREGEEAAAAARVLVATDARRKEVYTATYTAQGGDDVTRVSDIEVLAPAVVAERLAGEGQDVTHVAGSGITLYPELALRPALAPVSGDATTQIRLALARREAGEELSTEPLYLRHADVQMPTRTKRHQ